MIPPFYKLKMVYAQFPRCLQNGQHLSPLDWELLTDQNIVDL